MIEFSRKTRLLVGATFGAAAFLAATPASAACPTGTTTTANDSKICAATTTTTDTTGTAATDRNSPFTAGLVPTFFTVNSGVLVDGFGAAWSQSDAGTNTTTITNNGLVQVNAGNLATAGGSSALSINSSAAPVIYQGTGTVLNLGTAGDGLGFSLSGAGGLVANVGGNVRSAVNGTAIVVNNSGTGGSSVTTATGTTLSADLVGVWVRQTNAANAAAQSITNNSSVISVTSPGSLDFGIGIQNAGTGSNTIVNNGAIGSASDRLGSIGIFSDITNAASTASSTTTGSGAIFASGRGIDITNAGSGSTTVNYTGVVNATAVGINVAAGTGATSVTTGAGAITSTGPGGVGVNISNTTGAVTATTGSGAVTGADYGVQVASTGTQAITAGGVVTGTAIAGIHSNTTANRVITINAAGNVTGGTEALLIANTGTATVNNSGIVGVASTGLAVQATGAGAVQVNNNATGVLNGRLTLTGAADRLVNNGTFNTQGTTDFGVGADALDNNLTGIININGTTAFTGLETFNQSGRINLNSNILTLSGTAFNNAGTLDTSGNAAIGGITSFSNSGTLDLAPGTFTVPAVAFTNSGTILADEGVSAISGQASFANSGTIDLQDGATGDVLTINSSYAGSGGSNLLVDFDDTQSDRLVVGAASGTTTVNANYTGLGLIDLDGVLVVDTTSTTANAFLLGTVGGNTSPLVSYALVQSGTDFFLTSAPTADAFNPVALTNLAGSLWYQSADEVIAQTDLPSGLDGFGAWGQVYYSQDKYGDDDDSAVIDGTVFSIDNELKTDRYGIQAGVEYGFGGARIGLTGGYGVAKADNDLNNDLKAKGYNVGIYGAFGGLTGFHGSALLKYDRYNVDFDGGAFEGVDSKLRATGVDGSLGYRFGIGGEATLDAKVGLAHVRTKIDDVNAFGFNYDIGKVTSTRGRAGLRAAFGGNLGFYAEGSVLREFKGDGDVELFDGATFYDLESTGKGTWFRLEAGLAPQLGSGPILAAWADLGDKKGFGIRAGFRFGGAREEVLPPPPPPVVEAPPPPPPPATQTCPDGSVILASDACPPPPPPPPPAPTIERG